MALVEAVGVAAAGQPLEFAEQAGVERPAGNGVVSVGLPESQFQTRAPLSTSKARMTPDCSCVE